MARPEMNDAISTTSRSPKIQEQKYRKAMKEQEKREKQQMFKLKMRTMANEAHGLVATFISGKIFIFPELNGSRRQAYCWKMI